MLEHFDIDDVRCFNGKIHQLLYVPIDLAWCVAAR